MSAATLEVGRGGRTTPAARTTAFSLPATCNLVVPATVAVLGQPGVRVFCHPGQPHFSSRQGVPVVGCWCWPLPVPGTRGSDSDSGPMQPSAPLTPQNAQYLLPSAVHLTFWVRLKTARRATETLSCAVVSETDCLLLSPVVVGGVCR